MIAFNPIALLPFAEKVLGWFGKKRDQGHDLRMTQLRTSGWFLKLFSAAHLILPIDYAMYLSARAAWPLESPEEVAHVISTTLAAFPTWWTASAISILLAAWGLREKTESDIAKSEARTKEHRAEAAKTLQNRKYEERHQR